MEGLNQTIINLELEKSELLKEMQMLRRETEQLTDELIQSQAQCHRIKQEQATQSQSQQDLEALLQQYAALEREYERVQGALLESVERERKATEQTSLVEVELALKQKENASLEEQVSEERAMREREEAAGDVVRKRLVEMKLVKELEQEEMAREIGELQKRTQELTA